MKKDEKLAYLKDAHFGLEFYNKYIHNNDRTRKTSKA